MGKIVHSLLKTINFQDFGECITMTLECDDFVFRKVNWPLPLKRGGWVGGFQLNGKITIKRDKT